MTNQVVRLREVGKKFRVKFNPSPSLKSKFIGLINPRYREKVEEFWALRDIDIKVEKGESVGVIGPNGSGKSTLLKIIAGILRATTGTVEVTGMIAPMIELGVGFNPELTGIENTYLNASFYGLGRKAARRMIPEIHEFSELGEFINVPIKNYSSGMVVRLAFSIAVQLAPDLLLIDEILAVGDAQFQRKCQDRMQAFRRSGRTIVLVSHGLEQVAQMCDRAYFIHAARVRSEGPTSDVIEAYAGFVAGNVPAAG
jgi:ABC-type polysaccharide/polyol phosphate transport system ATPase subunit